MTRDRFDEMAESIMIFNSVNLAKALRTLARSEWKAGNRAGQERRALEQRLKSCDCDCCRRMVDMPILDEDPTDD